MSSVSSSTSSVSSSTSTKKLTFTGLASGLDTEEIVKQLMSSSQTKIDKAKQQKQLLEWKRTAYRNTTTLINDFKNKYFDVLSSNYIGSASFFAAKNITSSSSSVSAVATSSAQNATITINSATMAKSAVLTSASAVSPSLTGTEASADLFSSGSAKVKFTLDGVTKEIEFTSSADLQTKLNSAFGSGKINVSVTDNKYTFQTADTTSKLSLYASSDASHTNDLTNLGFTSGQSNHISTSTKINTLIDFGGNDTYKLKINDVEISIGKDDTVSQVMSKINSSSAGITLGYSSFTDTFSLTSKATGQSAAINVQDDGGEFLGKLFGAAGTTASATGSDATVSVTVGGVEQTLTRSSNTFEINGVNITISSDITEKATIGVSTSTDTAVTNLKNFISDYNTLVDSIYSTTQETYDKNYPPLTDAQREEMSEKEIEDWEKKAKTGLLSNDEELKGFISDLRDVLYSSVKSAGLSAYAIGIDTTSTYSDGGKLQLNEDKLKKALEENSQGVIDLFSNSETGLATKYTKVMNSYASTKVFNTGKTDASGKAIFKKGSLVELAGYSDKDTDYEMYEDLKDINEKISDLKTKYDTEYNRVWAQFTSLEKAISQLNSQSSWLSSMFG